jgi:cellulose synthase/poly-beta-1,6-N-acetylglucosamine synthase-like glycosyltransferase
MGLGVARRAAAAAVGTIAVAGTLAVSGSASYLGVLTLAAKSRNGRRQPPVVAPSKRFVLLVPAHDEELVIGLALEAFRALEYPADLFSVHVVADNCTDRTAEIVRNSGFHAHERDDRDNPGKGPALNWLLDSLIAAGKQFDVVVIVDADTTVHPQFLRRMNDAFCGGAVAAQGFYGVRDAGASATAGVRYAALACRHHLRPLGRTALGGSCGLYGNGMAFDVALMRGRRWSGHLIEDAEFQMELLLDGHLVAYVPEARIEAEMPDSTTAATSQNERWELGRLQLAQRFVPTLFRRSIAPRDPLRIAYLDAAIDHLVPPLSVLVAANAASTATSIAGIALGSRRSRLAAIANIVSAATIAIHVVTGLRSVKAPASVYRSLLDAPRLIWWKLRLWLRVVSHPDDVGWTRTSRNAAPDPAHERNGAS